MSKHAIVHVEFAAHDPKTLGDFYSQLFGWKTQPSDQMDYIMFSAEDGPGGGFPKVDGTNVKPGEVVASVSTDDIEASLAQAEALGGKTLVPKAEIPGMGWYAVFADPDGNKVGLWTDAPGQSS